MIILNITQELATLEQYKAGVRDFYGVPKDVLQQAVLFKEIPTIEEIRDRARKIAQMVSDHGGRYAMLGGPPYFMAPLEEALRVVGVIPLYSFMVQESVEEQQPDGTMRGVQVFRHKGFIKV